MQILTFRLKPRVLFGAILALTGITVIIVTFVSNHSKKAEQASAQISCSTAEERADYINSLGWEFDTEKQKKIIIPSEFSRVYEEYYQKLDAENQKRLDESIAYNTKQGLNDF